MPQLYEEKIAQEALTANHHESIQNPTKKHTSDLPQQFQQAAQDLLEIMSETANLKSDPSMDQNFYQIGGDSLNSVETVAKLNEKGHEISVSEFIKCGTLYDIIKQISVEQQSKPKIKQKLYQPIPLQHEHKEAAIEIIAQTFVKKGNLECYLTIQPQAFRDFLGEIWDDLISAGYSFVMADNQGEIVALNFNFDLYHVPEFKAEPNMQVILTFLEHYETPLIEQLPFQNKGEILYLFMVGVADSLTPAQNVELVLMMEEHAFELARDNGFKGILTTNINPLTQQVGELLGYKTIGNYQVNEYMMTDGWRPFAKAPDAQRSLVMFKQFQYR